jgi:ribosomal protein S18 acetylase RimI-like enzyme
MDPERIKEVDKRMGVEVCRGVTDEFVAEVKKLDDEVIPEQMRYDIEDLKSCFEVEAGVHIAVRDQEGKLAGYLTSVPHNDEFDHLHEADPEFVKDDSALYIESVVMKNGDFKTGLTLMNTLLEEAKNKGYNKITMHTRVSEGLSSALQKRYGAKFFRRIEDWYGFGEPFDYLEIEL